MPTIDDVPLPQPWDWCYEWDGPYGTRKFSAAAHNGNKPTRSVPVFTAEQMHAHAAAVIASQRQPLDYDRAHAIFEGWYHDDAGGVEFVRRVEAAHGIGAA